jgi:hypothetical protein
MLSGSMAYIYVPALLGAVLIGLQKLGGGVRPIAVAESWH